jgi:hypothetical protein
VAARPQTANPEVAVPIAENPAEPQAEVQPKSPARDVVVEPIQSANGAAAINKQNEPSSQDFAVPDLRQRAAGLLGATQPAATGTANKDSSYVWVGRFQVESRAQDAAKKIEDLGLPAFVIPRHTDNGDFFVVFTGPFGAKRMPSVLQWLETQGFPNARALGRKTGAQDPNETQVQNPNP